MARPEIILNPDQVREVETLAALLSQEQIADYFGIARNTFRAICDRDADVLEHYKRGKAKAIAHVANGLLQKARAGCTTSSIFYLKTQAGWNDRPDLVPEGADGEPSSSASDKLKAFLDEIAAKSSRVGVDRLSDDELELVVAGDRLPPPEAGA